MCKKKQKQTGRCPPSKRHTHEAIALVEERGSSSGVLRVRACLGQFEVCRWWEEEKKAGVERVAVAWGGGKGKRREREKR